MKVAIFVDGKNFYKGYQQHAIGRRLNFPRLTAWLTTQAGGSLLVGCHYYTGLETGTEPDERRDGLAGFLTMLEMQRGYFVHRFPRRTETFCCKSCGADNTFTKEKEVDTTMVADMLQMAAVGAFDALVLVSGDADHAPAVEGVRSLGKIVFVSTWGGHGLAPRIRRASFDHIDLVLGLPHFEYTPEELAAMRPTSPLIRASSSSEEVFLNELRRAQNFHARGYVGVKYFLTRWKGEGFDMPEADKQHIFDQLLRDGKVELYDVEDGKKGLRITETAAAATATATAAATA